MTELEAYRSCLIELNKVLAPAILLDDFNYLFRKAILNYFNKKYSLFEVNQLLTDDLRVLTKTKKLTAGTRTSAADLTGPSYKYLLPSDYVHILNCICEFKYLGKQKCADSCAIIRQGANKLDSSLWPSVITNYYMRPSMKQPYYYISNIDEPEYIDTPEVGETIPTGSNYIDGKRYGNTTIPILEIKCGNLDKSYMLNGIYVDYLRAPLYVELTKDDLDAPIDKTHVIEFPDYVVYEIINELVFSLMENQSNARVLTFPNMMISTQPVQSQTR